MKQMKIKEDGSLNEDSCTDISAATGKDQKLTITYGQQFLFDTINFFVVGNASPGLITVNVDDQNCGSSQSNKNEWVRLDCSALQGTQVTISKEH